MSFQNESRIIDTIKQHSRQRSSAKTSAPAVDIIIPHFNGVEILDKCLASLEKTSYTNLSIVIVDNGTVDESLKLAAEKYKRIRIFSAGKNLGYAGGCNFGFQRTRGKYVVFLNNDTEQEPDWLERLVEIAEKDEQIAALQPKLLSMHAKMHGEKVFDYAGAAGGMLDALGYPYARGRVFNSVEADHGQYDTTEDIFWASGAAMMVRRAVVEQLGGFDSEFFAHMEEIDLCWRMKLAGYRVVCVPSAVVYHYGGATLAAGNPRKIYLNHRNNVMMIVKNASLGRLLWLFPVRLALELASLLYYQCYAKEYVRYVWRALWWNLKHLPETLSKRRTVQTMRKCHDKEIFKNSGGLVVLKKVIFGRMKTNGR